MRHDEALLGDPRLPARFWAKVTPVDGCWIWTGARSGAHRQPRDAQYGYIRIDGKSLRAHRVAYEAFVGPIPAGLQIDHLCRTRPCVNPAHLEVVTNRENGLRGISPAALCARKTHCVRGHEFSPQNTAIYNGKRSCMECNRIKARIYANSGAPDDPDIIQIGVVAALLGVHVNTVRNYVARGALAVAFTMPSGQQRYSRRSVEALREMQRNAA